MINPMNFLMNRFGLKRTTTVVATTVVAATLMYQAYNAYKARKARKARKAFQQPHVETDPPFEAKYFKEYDELEDDPDTPVPPMNAHVRETTPQGDVIMTYDADRVVFCYYCDTRSVQFKYLESVARKYVVTHGCKRIYIDFREELSKAKTKAAAAAAAKAVATTKPTTKPTAKPTAKAISSVFAQLKKYSMTSVPIINNNSNKLLRANNANNATANDERACVLKEQVTRYLYCGRLDDFIAVSEGRHATETHDFNIIKPIDYASYKKMNDA
jgi:hypothetical protein